MLNVFAGHGFLGPTLATPMTCPKSCCALVFDTVLVIRNEIRIKEYLNRITDLLRSKTVFLTLSNDNLRHTIGA